MSAAGTKRERAAVDGEAGRHADNANTDINFERHRLLKQIQRAPEALLQKILTALLAEDGNIAIAAQLLPAEPAVKDHATKSSTHP